MRNWPELPAQNEDDNLLAKPRSKRNESILWEFASLDYRVGFESKQIHSLIRRGDADREIARNALLEARRQAAINTMIPRLRTFVQPRK